MSSHFEKMGSISYVTIQQEKFGCNCLAQQSIYTYIYIYIDIEDHKVYTSLWYSHLDLY